MANNIITARKAELQITDTLTIEVFTTNDVDVIYGYAWVESFGINKALLSKKTSKYHLSKLSNSHEQAKRTQDSKLTSKEVNSRVKVQGIDKPYNTLSRKVLAEVLQSLVLLGHSEVLPILTALATEALEERAKQALGIDATSLEDKEKKTREIARELGKQARIELTDGMKAWGQKTGLKPNYGGGYHQHLPRSIR